MSSLMTENWMKKSVSQFLLTLLVSHGTRVSDDKSFTVESRSISRWMKLPIPCSPYFGFEWFYSLYNVYKSLLIKFRLQKANPDKFLTLRINFSSAIFCKCYGLSLSYSNPLTT